jgi:succinylglutamate desuccinylase
MDGAMSSSTTPGIQGTAGLERIVGRARGAREGARVVVVAGIHGNEPAGLAAARRVLAGLQQPGLDVRGEVVVVAGNVGALQRRQRYAVRDLNRGWDDDSVAALRARDLATLTDEDAEQRELLEAIDDAFAGARGPRVLVDLHTSSAPGIPFLLFGDTLAQIGFVRDLPVPALLGLVEQVEGILAEYWTRRGAIAFCVEGGQHDDEAAVDNLAAAVWTALARADVVDDDVDDVVRARVLLEARRAGVPGLLEVVRRHAITPDDEFTMEPGFLNIAPVRRGRLLARDRRGEIRADDDGAVVLPLYQKLGSDGFFWARAVTGRRLQLATLLRRLPVDALARRLPGIEADGDHPHRIVVRDDLLGSDGVRGALFSRLWPLLGYRRRRPADEGRTCLERLPG